MRTLIFAVMLIGLSTPTVATDQEDAAADTVAAAFVQARQSAHRSRLERMGRNAFREKVCEKDLRFSSGMIHVVLYQTSDVRSLPESALRLATSPDAGKTASRFGVGVCSINTDPAGSPQYSVLIATYESRPVSFWRIFWE